MKIAEHPFVFHTATYLTRIGNQKANRIVALCEGIRQCSDASIFYHTYQSLSRHHFLTEGFSNDFAQWALAACNRPELAEHLAALDVRDYVNLPALRGDLCKVVSSYCQGHPREAEQIAFEPFYFLESIEVGVPLGMQAQTLEEFHTALGKLSHAAFNHHFITSRLRLHLRTNDFSLWLSKELGLEELARAANRIDIYTNTLESAQARLLALVERGLQQ